MRLLPMTLIALCLAATPALADAKPTCWPMGESVGIFNWPGTPSTTCRDRAADQTPGVATLPRTSEARVSGKAASPAAGTSVTFSGEAYAGLAWAF